MGHRSFGKVTVALSLLVVACSNSPRAVVKGDASSAPESDAAAETSTDAAPAEGGADGSVSYDFSALESYLFGGQWVTEGAVVLHNGEVVFEQYGGGYDAGMRHITYSASKSVGSALVGIAISDGLLNLSDSICKYVPPVDGGAPSYCDTTIQSLLQMTSGFDWDENYVDPTTSDVLEMLYGEQADMGLYVASFAKIADAGAVWNYSSGDANLLAKALHNALGSQDVRAWANQKLFGPAGLTSAIFEEDFAGTLVFSSSCFMTPRDMARFGELYLENGSIGGTKVLPDGWVSFSITPAAAVALPTERVDDAGPGNSGGSYGASWWLNSATPDASSDTWMYPQATADTYSAEGHWGQKIFVVPSRHLVVARTGNDRDPDFDPGPMVGYAVAAIDQGAH